MPKRKRIETPQEKEHGLEQAERRGAERGGTLSRTWFEGNEPKREPKKKEPKGKARARDLAHEEPKKKKPTKKT
jgi:hypothetical protein